MRNLVLISMLLTVLITGCRGNSESKSPEEANITIDLSIAPNPPVVGVATLVVSLHNKDGEPINDATVAVRGDMNHAGMNPVVRELSEGEQGDYFIPFEWTMGGEWFVVVTATLANGTIVEQQFDYTVAGEMGMDTAGMDMGNDAMDMGEDANMDIGDNSATMTEEAMDMSEDAEMDMGNDSMNIQGDE